MKIEPDHEDIHAAAKSGDTDEVAAILSMDNRPTRSFDADGWSPLHLAAHYGHVETVELLLHNNAPVDQRSTNQLANTALHAALAGQDAQRRGAVARALIAAGADVNAKQHGGWAPMHQAAAANDRALVDYLLAKGASATVTNDAGTTPAAIARERGHNGLSEYLEQRAAG